MLKQIEGSLAIAEAVALSRPTVISCYPITPQTHIVEALSAMVRTEKLRPCEFLNVESEFAALSVLIGASAAGARCYTATSSQGLLFMAEAVYNASGLRLPIVMTIGNRAIGAPINIWNDHSDSMALRDAGWIQLYAESNQEAVDLHLQAFRLAEELSCPVMVCVDGFILTHAMETIDVPGQVDVDRFLPAFRPRQVLNPAAPISIGAMVGPDAYTEVRHELHEAHLHALESLPRISAAFSEQFGRDSGGLAGGYRLSGAETVIVALGSVNGTIQECVDELRTQGDRVGCLKIVCFRPFPDAAVRDALRHAHRVVVVEKNVSIGRGGALARDVRLALLGTDTPVHTVIAGLGGRPITRASLLRAILSAEDGALDEPHFLDLKRSRTCLTT
jgi:pyruvate ferredoxin oxidoreductase alpha subunit